MCESVRDFSIYYAAPSLFLVFLWMGIYVYLYGHVWVRGHMLTRQMLTRQMLTRQMLTRQMLTTLMEKETFAHNFFYNLYL